LAKQGRFNPQVYQLSFVQEELFVWLFLRFVFADQFYFLQGHPAGL
jgi:hypothetical protein